jgi:rare lipoprotein A (peptidoglycan hydrolase)
MKKRAFYLKLAFFLGTSVNMSLSGDLFACLRMFHPVDRFVDYFEVEEAKFGKATMMDKKLHGQLTASGEIYNKNDLVAAHKTLPFGTCVRVTNLKNGRFVLVRINDNRTLSKGRKAKSNDNNNEDKNEDEVLIELSSKAAEQIGISKKDVKDVKVEVVKSQIGIASWYKEYEVKSTANGEIYDMDALTAAHRLFPFHTKLKVTNLSDGRSVIVRINDRGPWHKDRVIDLSREAARVIGAIGRGSVMVQLEVVDEGF